MGYMLCYLDAATELTVEESPREAAFAGPEDISSGPGSLSSGEDDDNTDLTIDSTNTEKTLKTTAKRKTPLSKVGHGFL